MYVGVTCSADECETQAKTKSWKWLDTLQAETGDATTRMAQ